MKKILLLFVASSLLCGCTRSDHAIKVLEDAGYSHIEITGWRPFSCSSDDDAFATGFKATGPTGHQVTGVVCEGFLKGSTIRFD